ncbi:MAG: phage tail protein, partial [Shewanella sp.]
MSEVVAAEMLRAVLTKKGLAAANQAATLGKPVKISHVGVTGTPGTPNADMTTLPGEVGGRLKIADGKVISDTQVNVSALLPDTFPSVTIHGVGYYLEDGTLFSVYQSQTPLLIHTQGATLLIGMDFVLENIPNGSVIVESTGANLIMGDWVPTYRKLNGKVMDKDIHLTAHDVGGHAANNGPVQGHDWDTLTKPGSYSVQLFTGANAPEVSGMPAVYGYGTLFVQNNSETISQMYIADNDRIYLRDKFRSNPWGKWKAVAAAESIVIDKDTDFNTLTMGGTYSLYKPSGVAFSNAPSGFLGGTLFENGGGAGTNRNFITQNLTERTTLRQWARTRSDSASGWSEWALVYNSKNKPSLADLGAASSGHNHNSDYLSLANGGTVRRMVKIEAGAATAPGLLVGTSAHKAAIGTSNNSGEVLFGSAREGGEITSYLRIGHDAKSLKFSPDASTQYEVYHKGNKPTLAELGYQDQDLSSYVQKSRKINGKPLDADITLKAGDVAAAPQHGLFDTSSASGRISWRMMTLNRSDAHTAFTIAGQGDHGERNRGWYDVMIATRSGAITVRAFQLGTGNADPLELYTKLMPDDTFEVWATFADYNRA